MIDKIVRRQSSNALRRTHREDPIEGISAELDPSLAMEDVVVSQDAVERIIALVGEMKENYREVLRLKYENDYSHEEISDFLGITVDAAKQRLHRARNKLKLMMEAEEVGGNGK
ncbi:hypothetical protein FACS18949_06140 [Clostridia bacterium]|nr:hypothetical protein FACS18949_06140 [Clostridia bacterium]